MWRESRMIRRVVCMLALVLPLAAQDSEVEQLKKMLLDQQRQINELKQKLGMPVNAGVPVNAHAGIGEVASTTPVLPPVPAPPPTFSAPLPTTTTAALPPTQTPAADDASSPLQF